jgi:hypothetical protein
MSLLTGAIVELRMQIKQIEKDLIDRICRLEKGEENGG